MKIIGAFDRGRVSTLVPRSNSVLIMITCEHDEFPEVHPKWSDILQLKFDDIEGSINNIGSASNVMQEHHAKELLDFVIKHMNCDIFVNCDAGLSRSPAVVVALEQIFNSRDVTKAYPHYNRFVKNRIRDVWYKTIWEGANKDD
jgi:predicted protein tyrosine phosphatase